MGIWPNNHSFIIKYYLYLNKKLSYKFNLKNLKMIPSKNDSNHTQKIRIHLTSDNKCIIKSTLESEEKSKCTINITCKNKN